MSAAIGFRLSAVGLLLGAPLAAQQVPPIPDSSGWGVQVLASAQAPDGALWFGTYGQGILVLRPGATAWERIRSSDDTAAHAISWDFVHAFGFGARGQIWYGTVGNGWGVSKDGGKTWKNWEFRQLGPEWQYVAPTGIVTRGDTVYIATADGIKVTWDDGATWRVVTDSAGVTTARDSVWGRIRSQYVLHLHRGTGDSLVVWHLRGMARSGDGGRSWVERADTSCRRFCTGSDGAVSIAAAMERIGQQEAAPQAATAAKLRHSWFRRPIAPEDQSYIDQTYRFGSTMGGNFQPHQGVEFNNPNGTPVHAIGDGEVVWAGPAERGALTVAIRHSRKLTADSRQRLFVFSVYYHNSKLLVSVGQQVKAGAVIAQVGNTGRATNDHLHLEVHAAPTDSVRFIVDPEVRYPPFNTNPELWIDPLPGTGLVAGQVWDANGQPVQQARIYGLVKPQPQETPFSFIETYGPRNHSDPAYHEHFAISDVPPGEYVLGVEIEGKRVYRRVRVEPRKLTWVEFRPDVRN
ncbi:MAG TPA: M23 family metallopeptidase [Gemmatimonadales bacterium]|jgi:murein DD-endopeptidase MepM/ murein hydrolase activator NlpD